MTVLQDASKKKQWGLTRNVEDFWGLPLKIKIYWGFLGASSMLYITYVSLLMYFVVESPPPSHGL